MGAIGCSRKSRDAIRTQPQFFWWGWAVGVLEQAGFDGKRVLDVGAGHGYVIAQIRDRGAVPYAIDVSEESVNCLKEQGIAAYRTDLSCQPLPFEDNFFDFVIFTEVIEHIPFPQHALREIHRVLKPDGSLVISTHNSFNLYMRLPYFLGKVPAPDLDVRRTGQHMRLFGYGILSDVLQEADFKSISNQSRILGSVSAGKRTPKCLTSLLARHLYLVCRN